MKVILKIGKFYKDWEVYFLYLLLICIPYGCASVGNGPSGGEYDSEPPKFVKSNPSPSTVRFDKKKITLFFDEYISIEKPFEKVIISPPQKKNPSIKMIGKKIVVKLMDTLVANMTYSIDFTNGIVDNNEQNVLEDFSFAFSTGDIVDSLVVSGLLLNAENLEPMPHVMVGIHSDLSDTAFTNIPFLRISQTNESGYFQIKNIAPGIYHIFALDDKNKNFKFDSPSEALAFGDSLIVLLPSCCANIRMDTIWKDSLTTNIINNIDNNCFTANNNVLLRLFKENFELQYLFKVERVSENKFLMNFNSQINRLPEIRLVGENRTNWYIAELSPDKKTLVCWISDSLLYQKDTLLVETAYLAHNSLYSIALVTDTIQLVKKRKKLSKDKRIEEQKFLDININSMENMDIFNSLKIVFSEPVLYFRENWLHIWQKVGTLWEMRYSPVLKDSLNQRMYRIDYQWDYDQEYRIMIDSASVFSIYNKWNNFIQTDFKIKAKKEYGYLYVQVNGIDNNGFGQLLNSEEKVIKESLLIDNGLTFDNIQPGKYYLRYIEDINNNGKWDTGNYAEKKQPEPVYYYPNCFEIQKYMKWEQIWNVKECSIDKQKPLEIIKNKMSKKQFPKDKKSEE